MPETFELEVHQRFRYLADNRGAAHRIAASLQEAQSQAAQNAVAASVHLRQSTDMFLLRDYDERPVAGMTKAGRRILNALVELGTLMIGAACAYSGMVDRSSALFVAGVVLLFGQVIRSVGRMA